MIMTQASKVKPKEENEDWRKKKENDEHSASRSSLKFVVAYFSLKICFDVMIKKLIFNFTIGTAQVFQGK